MFYKDKPADVLTEEDGGYTFRYLPRYLSLPEAEPVSLTLPLRAKSYESRTLFPFFDGLIPEGWLLNVALRNTDICVLDRMSLLLLCCKDCIGAVSVVPMPEAREAENAWVPALLPALGWRGGRLPRRLLQIVLWHARATVHGLSRRTT